MTHGDEEAVLFRRQAYMIYVESEKTAKKKHIISNLKITIIKNGLQRLISSASHLFLFSFFWSSLRETSLNGGKVSFL